MIGRLLCKLGFHQWHRPAVWAREVCLRCQVSQPQRDVPLKWWQRWGA